MEMSGWMLALLILAVFSTSRATNIVSIRGGATKDRFLSSGNVDYYEQFDIDYGIDDNRRKAGSLRGFIRSGALASIPQSDSFLQWLQLYTEEGPLPYKGRLKAYHVKQLYFLKNLFFYSSKLFGFSSRRQISAIERI